MHAKFWLKNVNGRDPLEDLGIYGRKILEQILRKQGEKLWTGFIWLGIRTSVNLWVP
jgi:hypothetical protein